MKNHPLLQKLKSTILQDLAVNSSQIILQRNMEYLLNGDKDSAGLYILISGKISEFWGDRALSEKESGTFPAIQLIVDRSIYKSTIKVREMSRMIMISRPAYLLLLSEEPLFQMELTKELVKINRQLLQNH
ncbi:MAG: hypothetical protein JEY91_03810 [Spirochaetaceae bacterium]|nr:hypothetical protein [Spirochaetaceae bacterium]